MTGNQDRFWQETRDYRTYREALQNMSATVSRGLKDYGVTAVWTQEAAVFGLATVDRYMLFAFTDLGKSVTATGKSADEALGSMERQLEDCKDLDKETGNERQ